MTENTEINVEFELVPEPEIFAEYSIDQVIRDHGELSGRDKPNQHPIDAIEGLSESLASKIDKTNEANQVYGTDDEGNPITYDKNSFGAVDDVTIDGVSIVTDKIAELGSMASESSSNYYTSSEIDTKLEEKQDTLVSGESIKTLNGESLLGEGNILVVSNQEFNPDWTMDSTTVAFLQDVYTDTSASVGNSYVGALACTDLPASLYNAEATVEIMPSTTSAPKVVHVILTSGTTSPYHWELSYYVLNNIVHNSGWIAFQPQMTNGTGISIINNTISITSPTLKNGDNISQLTNDSEYQTALQVSNAVATETNARELADNGLQEQIDAIVSSSDVFDIVGTYAELQAYDISTVPVNDIIKVLVDETHSGAATYYRCVENDEVKSWSYIGSEGAYYTKSESDNKFVPQTRTINGKALSSDISLTAGDVSALPSSTTIGDGTLTIQINSTDLQTFTANQTGNVTANISVPTDTGDLTNNAGFITSSALSPYVLSSSLATVATSGSYKDLINTPAVTTNTGITYVGASSSASTSGTALGYDAKTTGIYGIAIGRGAKSGADYAYQIGYGTSNTTSYSLRIGFGATKTYILLDGNTGLIPDDRISTNIARTSAIPTDTSDLTNGAGYITGISSTDVTTALGYTPYSDANPDGYTSNVGTVTSVNSTSPDSDGNVTLSIPSDTSDLTNGAGFITSSALDDYVTKNTNQEITGEKTFKGQKRIIFKQSGSSDKLGFTLKDNSNNERGYLEYNPGNTVDGANVFTLGSYSTNASYRSIVGFRYYDGGNSAAYNLLAPLAGNAKSAFSLTTTYTNFYQILGISNGTSTVTTANTGVIDISSITVQNTATGTNSVTLFGTANANAYGVNIGYNSSSTGQSATAIGSSASANIAGTAIGQSASAYLNSTALGVEANAGGANTIAIGRGSVASGLWSIQLGYGSNAENNSLYVGLSNQNGYNYKLLGSNGKIPAARLPIATSVSSSSTDDEAVGAKLFYDTCGDIETLINAL